MRANDAVERGLGQVAAGQIGNDRSTPVGGVHVQHVALSNPVPAKLSRIGITLDFQHAPADVLRVRSKKMLDVITIYGLAARFAAIAPQRRGTAQDLEASHSIERK